MIEVELTGTILVDPEKAADGMVVLHKADLAFIASLIPQEAIQACRDYGCVPEIQLLAFTHGRS